MRIKQIKCPSCGAPLDIKKGADTCECLSCGCVFAIDNGKLEYTYNKNVYIRKETSHTERYIDDADIIRARTEEKEKKRAWLESHLSIIALLALFVAVFAYMHYEEIKFDQSEKERNREIEEAINSGMISAGYYQDYLEKDYEGVVAQFEAAGFTNIQTIDLHDTGFQFWNNGEVESVSVGGNTYFSRSDYFSPDVKVVISYR